MKKVIYISVPMKDRSAADISADIKCAIEYCKTNILEFNYFDLEFIEPQELAENLAKKVANPATLDYFRYLSFDIETILRSCDTVVFCHGWKKSSGCRLEHAAAEIYGKEIIYL
jgi:hypothetical protein